METTDQQDENIDRVRAFIREYAPELMETAGDSRWTAGNILFRYESDEPGMYAYMVGPVKNGKVSWHLMPLYAVESIREKCAPPLKPFISGKSCIQFAHFDELPLDTLALLVKEGTPLFREAMEAHLRKRKPRK